MKKGYIAGELMSLYRISVFFESLAVIAVSRVVSAELIENLLDYGFVTFSMVQVYFYGKVVLSDINRFRPLHILRNVVVQNATNVAS